jgi:hypothetical protein
MTFFSGSVSSRKPAPPAALACSPSKLSVDDDEEDEPKGEPAQPERASPHANMSIRPNAEPRGGCRLLAIFIEPYASVDDG